MLNLKLQYFGHLMRRTDLCEKTLMREKLKGEGEWDNRGWDGWMASLTQGTWIWTGSGSQWWAGRLGMLQSMGSQRIRHVWVTEPQKCVLCIMNLFLFCFICFFCSLESIYKQRYIPFIFMWLISLSIVFFRSTHVVSKQDCILHYDEYSEYSIVFITSSLSFHLSDGYIVF